jgi:ABC-type transport system involved in multi-copper enzyme maturation permease subunit
MSTRTTTPYRSAQPPGRDDFKHLLWSEWTKFRTVRGWVIAMAGAAVLTALAVVTLASIANGKQNPAAHPTVAVGPNGEAVTDHYYFVHQPLDGNGSITARVTSLTGSVQPGQLPPGTTPPRGPQPWAKAGVIITASTRAGSAYAAVMATPGHGVRMQWNYTNDTAGLPGAASASSPRWLRLTRSGDTITGYDSANGSQWTAIGTVTLAGLPRNVQTGLFAASPTYVLAAQGFASNNFAPLDTQATATFDHVSLAGGQPGAQWSASHVGFASGVTGPPASGGCPQPPAPGSACIAPHQGPQASLARSGGAFRMTVYGGDIAPYETTVDPLETVLLATAIGIIAVIALGALYITAEYRRGLIRTTFTASPRRGRVLVAKAMVIGVVTFAAALVGTAVALPIAERKLASGGWVSSVYPVWSLTSAHGLRIVVGTAGLLAVSAILALSAGAVLRRSAAAITAVVVLVIIPEILGVVLPQGPADWVLRLTPAAAFGVQQGLPQYPQVMNTCMPYNGCFPLSPWAGFAVSCAWAAAALGLAVYLLRRRDA